MYSPIPRPQARISRRYTRPMRRSNRPRIIVPAWATHNVAFFVRCDSKSCADTLGADRAAVLSAQLLSRASQHQPRPYALMSARPHARLPASDRQVAIYPADEQIERDRPYIAAAGG